ncbi:MAG: protein kinase domain-containing protein [Gemmatimonadales bacterium]
MPGDLLALLREAVGDRYRVERLLGRGGMAVVYLAQDLKHDRLVAVKVLRPELTAALGRERFLREIQIAAKLNHPHVLALHDSGDAGGLLYYVMPYVEGESLHQRLEREGALPIEEAVQIARDVASALSYAHSRGVLHRDIKPGNILLSDGHAVVADFGLARAVTEAKTDRNITGSGLTIGTPSYMSPEQGSGEENLDARSDVYSLGCVLYELLAGDPPYVASTPQAILAKHAGAPVPSLRTVRPTTPEWLDRVLAKAMAKLPPDRFGSAIEFAAALAPEASGEVAARPGALRRWKVAALAAGAVGVAALVWAAVGTNSGNDTAPGLDTTKYAVLPFRIAGALPPGLALEQRFHDALARWSGVGIVDRIQITEALERRGADRPLTAGDAARLAGRLGAGRFILGEADPLGDSLRIRAVLYDSRSGRMMRERMIRVPVTLAGADSAIARLTDHLLLAGSAPAGQPLVSAGTLVLPALQALVRGEAGILQWNLSAADSSFAEALRHDPSYARAALWLALVRVWSNAPPARWQAVAEQASAGRNRLSARDRELADALVAQARGDFLTACDRWRRLTRTDPGGFTGWFGLATCLSRDGAVLRDRRSPSGWRFRTSYHESVRAYRRAFELLPSIHVGLRAGGYLRLRGDMLYTTGRNLRAGRALPPDTGSFHAYPEWEGDSLVFYPFPSEIVFRGATGRQEQHREGVLHQRRVFHQIAQSWVSYYPGSADALEALALSMELLGDPAALDTLRRARQLARTPAEALRVASSEIWVRLKFALPDDPGGLRGVRALADSILESRTGPNPLDPSILAGIAVLRGRAILAAELGGRAGAFAGIAAERPLARDGLALWAYAAAGGPADSLRALERRVASAIESSLPKEAQEAARGEYLSRAASLAFPEVALPSLTEATHADELLAAQAAAVVGRLEEARAVFPKLRAQRRHVLPERLTFDALYPEARLLVFVGNDSLAAQWLDPPLGALRRTAPQALADAFNAGALVRALALRAEIAERAGDRANSVRWARAVAILWEDADGFLAPIVERMRRIAGQEGAAGS